MNSLAINTDKALTMTRMEVADMVEREHNNVMKDIRRIIEQLGEVTSYQSYFTESTYVNSQNKKQPSYNLTKKGCELYATRMTGTKGTLFAVKYIEKFNEMEEKLNPKQQMSSLQMLQTMINQMVEQEQQMEKVTNKVVYLETEFNKESIEEGFKSNDNIALSLKIYSMKDKPHYGFIDAVAKHLRIYNTKIGYKDEYVNVVRSVLHGGTTGATVYYSDKSLAMISKYVEENFNTNAEYFKRGAKKGEFRESSFELNSKTYKFNKNTYEKYGIQL